MELEGRMWKSKKLWLIEIPSLDLMTQGKTKREAAIMIQDAIIELALSYFPDISQMAFEITIIEYKKNIIGVFSTNSNQLFSLVLKRQREISQTTVREAAQRLGSNSPNAYAQYERGKINISLDKVDELLHAANPCTHSLLRVI